jgi:NADH-quinone oxidoreductase subunit M
VIFAPLIIMTLLLGVYPALALDVIAPAVENLVSNYNAALLDAGLGQVADAANAH